MNDNDTNSTGTIGRRPPWNKAKLVRTCVANRLAAWSFRLDLSGVAAYYRDVEVIGAVNGKLQRG